MSVRYILKPCQDETLSSYLYRSQLKDDQRREAIRALLNEFDHNWDAGFDPDYKYSEAGVKIISDIVNCGVDNIVKITTFDHWLLLQPCRSRSFYCSHCILNDVAHGRHPSWRRNWDDFLSVTCIEHGIPMSQLDGIVVYSEKARLALSRACVEFTSIGPFCHRSRVLSLPSLQTSAGAWSYLWKFGRHIQYILTLSRLKGVLVRGVLKNLLWVDCRSAIETIIGLALRGHTKHFECKCLVSRLLRNPTGYQNAVETQSGIKKMMQGLTVTNLIYRLFALLTVGVFLDMFTVSEREMLFKVLQRLNYPLPGNRHDLKRELLSSEFTDYEEIIVALEITWPAPLRYYWASC